MGLPSTETLGGTSPHGACSEPISPPSNHLHAAQRSTAALSVFVSDPPIATTSLYGGGHGANNSVVKIPFHTKHGDLFSKIAILY